MDWLQEVENNISVAGRHYMYPLIIFPFTINQSGWLGQARGSKQSTLLTDANN